jgi:hypothetical protein
MYLESISDGRRLVTARSSSKPRWYTTAPGGVSGGDVANGGLGRRHYRTPRCVRRPCARRVCEGNIGQALRCRRSRQRLVIISLADTVIAADMAEAGLHLMALPQEFIDAVRDVPRRRHRPTNPLDLGVIFDFELYADIVARCLQVLAPRYC